MKKILPIIAVLLALFGYLQQQPGGVDTPAQSKAVANQALAEAYENRRSDVQVRGSGVVLKTLADDNKGSRHQRFILSMDSGKTLLVAHNIDLAPRIDSLRKGDTVEFYGEYEWDSRGGIVHWTHHDPRGRHVGGWLKHNGKTYQ